MARWLIEGNWRGPSGERIVHREITDLPKFADALSKQYGITFTDGTTLELSVRAMKPREGVPNLKDGYGSLIRKCYAANVWTVSELMEIAKRKAL